MNVLETLLDAIEKIIGIDRAELNDMLEVNLFEEDILDSLSAVSVISEVEKKLGKKINLREIPKESFNTVKTLSEAISKQI
ncbi:MAG: phosphopantetheine-binding protein [Clostridia bacterium]|nr:phosphopantetheine-binding protein [Clostridia bacterium]